MILNYPGGPNVTTRMTIRGREAGQRQSRRCDTEVEVGVLWGHRPQTAGGF